MRRLLPLTLAITTTATTPVTFSAEESSPINANVALSSNYIWRGQTQTLDEPALSGGFDYIHDSGFYFGIWGSNVDFGTNDNMELDYYGGHSGVAGEIGYDIGYISYTYPGGSSDFEEWYLGLDGSTGAVDLGLTYSFGVDSANDNIELSAGTNLGGVGATLTLGDYDKSGQYTSVSFSKELEEIELSVAWSEYDADAGSASDQNDVTFTIAKSF